MNLVLECLYSDLVRACFIDKGPDEFKSFAARFFQTSGFPLPSARMAGALRLLADSGVFLAGASLTGTFAYRVYYAGLFCLPPCMAHGRGYRKILDYGKWDADTLHLICHESRRRNTVDALNACMRQRSSICWADGETGVKIILRRNPPDGIGRALLEFLARDQVPKVVCHKHGIPVAVPDPARMAIFRLCSALSRKTESGRRKDRYLALELIPHLDKRHFVEMFEQLAEQPIMRPMLKEALNDADLPRDIRDECMSLTGTARYRGMRSWKRSHMKETLLHKAISLT